ncbi:MAG: hypothetical protein A2X54_07730 [Nitrospirae bacterium GWF2_44_13]|nr:MAG: hypothetical protein A2X54_07730 [Nitrospirae bacterium GWF2_44_13]OGW35731.1 MAG: hypothetical protein A2088_03455 [Nitrospirae bacterium GWD2_44_7]OGW65291.1 MAG: hypothetical protein A2222_00505 [Nitrospirae bacterium RIFOXYA2_FULL_44_9]HBG93422.1 hypothetical protein [Nitrospiraceae bacterium]
MAEEPFVPPILSYEQINEYAEKFLKKHKADKKLPVPIEEIIEFDLGLDIIPFPNLQKDFDIDGFISGDLTSIYVDQFILTDRPSRYRFTLAHEIGHFVLHKSFMQKIHPRSVSAWEDFVLTVDVEDYEWVEWQAYTFGGIVLVPRKYLLKDIAEQIKALKAKIALVKAKKIPQDSYKEYVINAIAEKLITTYDVSIDVLVKRISKEIEKGMISIP